MATVRLKQNGQMTIPAKIRADLRLAEGDVFEARVAGENIVLSPSTAGDRAIEAAVADGLADLRRGRTTPRFDSVKDFKAFRQARGSKSAPKRR